MNPAVFGSLPVSACSLGTQGADGSDRIAQTIYDADSQVLQVRKAVGTPIEIADVTNSYSANGKLRYVIDANGNRAEMRYDGHDRQVAWMFPSTTRPSAYNPATPASALSSAGVVNEGDYEAYTWDANGNRATLRKRDGSVLSYGYDALNRITVKVVPERSGLSSTHTKDVYYGYDLRGLQTYARFDGPSGEGVATAYDMYGRKSTETLTMDGVSRTLTSGYDANGARLVLYHPDGNYAYYHRNATGGLYYADSSSGPLFYPPYNPDGSVDVLYRWRPGTGWYHSTDYGYDGVQRLNAFSSAFANGSYNSTSTFTRNPASQIASVSRSNDAYAWTGAVNVDRGYTANGLNQYSAVAGIAFTHDANGNLTSDGTNSYVYDVENRMVSRSGGGSASLRYDPLGRLYETNGPVEGTVRFLYDGDAMVMEFDGAGAIRRRIVHGPTEGVDDPLVTFEGSGMSDSVRRYLFADERGSITALTDASGSVYAVNSYDEFGIPAAGNQGRFQYTGQAWVPELGLYYYKARMYSPTLGRFMQTDPIGYEDQFNLYGYVGDDPVNAVDPTGLQKEDKEPTLADRAKALATKAKDAVKSAIGLGKTAPDAAANLAENVRDEALTDAVDTVIPNEVYTSERLENGESGRFTKIIVERDKDGKIIGFKTYTPTEQLRATIEQPDFRPAYRGDDAENQEARRSSGGAIGRLLEALRDAKDAINDLGS